MGSIKNKIIFCFICLIFYTALSLSFYLIPFNSEVLGIITIFCTTIFSIFFILPAFLYSPIYSIVIGILYYIFFRLFEIIRMFTILDSTPVTLMYMMIQSAFGIIINVIGIILTCLTIYFIKNYIKNKGIDMALITALIIAFIKFVISGLSFSSFFFSFIINNITINNDLIIQQIISYVVSVVCTFIAVMISYFIYMGIKDKAFFSNMNNLNNENNENNLNKDSDVNIVNE
ncbi:NADH:ubiquinone oxidoreductase [uncultured Brachyspira sp.]|uniref:NADH:ubiquinone oxidoreductase n=1 Tax=uncultured Brachyspira sp. TaxID=221953 RepID=UPI002615CE84|nr:NADH:ubiquinone oxidoreductase [uncultured Brachyspira sp.]